MAFIKANLQGDLIVQAGNEDAHPKWGADGASDGTNSYSITSATIANPIVITTGEAHGLVVGQTVSIQAVPSNTSANGLWQVLAVVSSTQITIDSAGTGTDLPGGTLLKQAHVPQWRHQLYALLIPELKKFGVPIALGQYYLGTFVSAGMKELSDFNEFNIDPATYPYLEMIDIFTVSLYPSHYNQLQPTLAGVEGAVSRALQACQDAFDEHAAGTALEGKKLAVMETGVNMHFGGLRARYKGSPTEDIQDSATQWDMGGHANLLNDVRGMTWRTLILESQTETGLSGPHTRGLVNWYCAMHPEEDFDDRNQFEHFGLANYDGDFYRSATFIAQLNQVTPEQLVDADEGEAWSAEPAYS